MFVVFAALVFASCMKPFDLKFDDEPVIFLEAFPGIEDVVVFSIKPGYSYSNSALMPDFNPQIVFTVNGKEIPVSPYDKSRFGDRFPEDTYIAEYTPVPGDRMTVAVTSEGFRSIYAETGIPYPFPQRKIDYRSVIVGEREYNVLFVSFKDDVETSVAYGMQIYEETIYTYSDGEVKRYVYPYAGEQIADDFEFAPQSMEGINLNFNGWSVHNGVCIASWDDDFFSGQEKTISMVTNSYATDSMSSADSFYEHTSSGDRYDEYGKEIIGTYTSVSHNKIIFYTMSPEFYKYAVAQELIEDNADFLAGLAPSNFCYSNVIGGYGAFAGICSVDTDWITKEFIENNR